MIKFRMNHLVQWRLSLVQTTRQSIKASLLGFLRMLSAKLVTFDVTGTLLFFRTPVLEKYAVEALKFGIETDSVSLKKNFNEAWMKLNKEHPNFGASSNLGWKNWWERLVEKTFEGLVEKEENNKIKEIAKILIDFHTTKEAFSLRPGTIDLLEYLQKKPIQLGVISNYDPRLHQILESVNLKKYFHFILISYEFGHPKPDVRIFQEALKLGGCTSGDRAVHIGDDRSKDYLGAKAAGLKAILISSHEKDLKCSQIPRNEVFEDFYELKKYFEGEQIDS